jgi:hypothetical protein
MYISHNYILVHLSCHSITKTKQGPFTRVLRCSEFESFRVFLVCSSRSSSSPSRSWADSSFLDHFASFLLPWFKLWRELSLFTEGNQPIPHELADRVISWSRSQEPVFFRSSLISHDRLEIGCWCLEDIFSTLLRTYLQSFKSIRVVLIEFWPILPRFVLLFLDSAEPPWKNAEPPGPAAENLCLGSLSARFEIRLLFCLSSISRNFF